MGENTTNKHFYKPALGASGTAEKALFDAKLDRLDTLLQIDCANYDHPNDAITAIGSDNKTLIVTEVEICDVNFTVPANVTVKFERGGKWTINNGIIVTFNGKINAGLWQIFEYVGTGKLSFALHEVRAEWFNDIQRAIDSLPSSAYYTNIISLGAGVVRFDGIFTITSTLEVRNNIHLIGDGRSSRINGSPAYSINCIEFTKNTGEDWVTGVLLKDFTITHGLIGINMEEASNTVIDKLLILGCQTGGIRMKNGIGNTITDGTHIHECGYGIKLTASTGLENNANTISGIYVNQCTGVGIQFENGTGGQKNNRIVDSCIEYNAGNIRILSGYSNVISNVYTEGVTGGGYSIIVDDDPSTGQNAFNTIIENCFSIEQHSIQIIGATNTFIRSCKTTHASGQLDITAEGIDTKIYDKSGFNTISDAGVGTITNLKVKLDATSAPGVTNDIDEGYVVGSRWLDITNDKEYVCLDNSDGAAVWKEIAFRTDKLSAFAATTSLELKGIMSDETGSGALVFGTSPALTTPTGIVKGDVGLGNVDNTSDATKNAASVILTNKTLTTPNISQVVFPATQVPSANANTLDDYEEGTWTPALKFGGNSVDMTYTTQAGEYTKIGRQVSITAYILLSAKGSSVGDITITGLPFTCKNADSAMSAISLRLQNVTFANIPQGWVYKNSTVIFLEEITEGGTVTALTEGNIANNSYIVMSATYFV